MPAGTQGVRLEVEIPDAQVLLSDFDLWHYPLNYWYLPDDEEDDWRFERRCAEKGATTPRSKDAGLPGTNPSSVVPEHEY